MTKGLYSGEWEIEVYSFCMFLSYQYPACCVQPCALSRYMQRFEWSFQKCSQEAWFYFILKCLMYTNKYSPILNMCHLSSFPTFTHQVILAKGYHSSGWYSTEHSDASVLLAHSPCHTNMKVKAQGKTPAGFLLLNAPLASWCIKSHCLKTSVSFDKNTHWALYKNLATSMILGPTSDPKPKACSTVCGYMNHVRLASLKSKYPKYYPHSTAFSEISVSSYLLSGLLLFSSK